MSKLIFAVTNDLSYDQRMDRIAATLADAGYEVLLVGRKRKDSKALTGKPYRQKRLFCGFDKGILFYAVYSVRLCWFLLWQPADVFCAIDLDTILPVYIASRIRKKKRVYDAHELFTEQKEVLHRKAIHRFWLAVERFAIPRFSHGYTVNGFIQSELQKRYGVTYSIIRNLPRKTNITAGDADAEKWILYQGSVNEGRCFETLIPAMQKVNARLVICGKGNFFDQTQSLIKQYGVEDKVLLKGYLLPEELAQLTPKAYTGLTLFEREGMNQYYSLANRFFDYIMAGVPQVCVNYPEYASICARYPVALLIDDTKPATIAEALNNLLSGNVLHKELQQNCLAAREVLNWENESAGLRQFYKQLG